MNIYDTLYMLAAIEELTPEPTFFKRRYFPTDLAMDVFGTSKVLADYKEGNRKAAPFVVPRIGPARWTQRVQHLRAGAGQYLYLQAPDH